MNTTSNARVEYMDGLMQRRKRNAQFNEWTFRIHPFVFKSFATIANSSDGQEQNNYEAKSRSAEEEKKNALEALQLATDQCQNYLS